MLPFHTDALNDWLQNDSLIVFGRGLGTHSLLLSFLEAVFFEESFQQCPNSPVAGSPCRNQQAACQRGKKRLIFLLNTSQEECQVLTQKLLLRKSRGATSLSSDYIKFVNSDTQLSERTVLFSNGGCFVVSSRILVTDLLTGKVPSEIIDGLIVNHAHRLLLNWNDRFILREFRARNKRGFIKGITDHPELINRGFSVLEKIMKCLLLRKVMFYPRFDEVVESSLSGPSQPKTNEVTLELSSRVSDMQHAALSLIQKGLGELKKSRRVDIGDQPIESCMLKSFELQIQEKLEPVWHSLHPRTRRLVQDLSTVRKLLGLILKYDCVTLLSYLESLRASEAEDSVLLTTVEFELLLKRTQERVFKVNRKRLGSRQEVSLEPVLEINAKWEAVRKLVIECDVPRSITKKLAVEQNLKALDVDADSDPCIEVSSDDDSLDFRPEYRILIACNDDFEHRQYSSMLMMQSRNCVKSHFFSYAASHSVAHRQTGSASKLATKVTPAGPSRELQKLFGDYLENNFLPTEGGEREITINSLQQAVATTVGEELNVIPKPLIVKASGYHSNFELKLQEFNPHCVILTVPDLQLVRELETYCAEVHYRSACFKEVSSNPSPLHRKCNMSGQDIRVYLCVYQNSVDQFQFLNSLTTEKAAWDGLFHQKKHLLLPEDLTSDHIQDLQNTPCDLSEVSSRQGGGGRAYLQHISRAIKPSIVVDMREFRSALPFNLYLKQFQIIPLTIPIGDYVLSRDICVERKSLPDLFSSLNSGRLYYQAREMCRYYVDATLLIEFEKGKQFSLQSRQALGTEVDSTNILSKLILLVLHFPSLKLLWSSQPSFTASMFTALKVGREQPNPDRAVLMGTDPEPVEQESSTADAEEVTMDSSAADATISANVSSDAVDSNTALMASGGRYRNATVSTNPAAIDILRKLPGVQERHINQIVSKVSSLRSLVQMSEAELATLIGRENAKMLYSFVNAKAHLVENFILFDDVAPQCRLIIEAQFYGAPMKRPSMTL